jgi:adenylyltransferase/sulfurtransferase
MNDFTRYARQMILPEIGKDGQNRLSAANVLCVGAGGLGCPVLLYLAGAGVGHIGIIDNDVVDESNLQRQTLYTMADIGRSKVVAAQERLQAFNPNLQVTPYNTRLTAENALEILAPYDIIIDGSDNFATRFLVNDACVRLQKPLVYGSVQKFEGQASVFDAAQGPCYRCLFPEIPEPGMGPSCAEAGVLGVMPGLIGMIQATEALKIILGTGNTLRGRLLVLDALSMAFHQIEIPKDKDCPCCGNHAQPVPLHDYNTGGCTMNNDITITPRELQKMIQTDAPLTLVDVREPDEHAVCKIMGAQLIPLRQIPARVSELDKNKLIVLHCHHGRRSLMALQFLQEEGFTQLKNLEGGIDAWAEECDPKMVRY